MRSIDNNTWYTVSAWHWVVLVVISICFFGITDVIAFNGLDSIHGVRVVTALKLISICSIGTLLRILRAGKVKSICRSFPLRVCAILLISVILSCAFVDAWPSPLEFIGQTAGLVALLVILLDGIQCLPQLEFFMRGLFCITCFVALVALLPSLGGSIALANRYVMDQFGGNRLTFGLLNANEYAYRLAIMALFGLYLWSVARSLAMKLFYGGGIVLFLVSIPLTYSRGAMITLLFMFVLGIGVLLTLAKSWSWILLLSIGLTSAIPYGIATDRLATLGHLGGDESAISRERANAEAWDAFLEEPILGVGGNRTNLRLPEGRGVHNGYLLLLADLGIGGFVPFILLLGGSLCRLKTSFSRNTSARLGLAAVFLGVGTIGWAVSMIFTVASYPTWICMGLAWACTNCSEDRRQTSGPQLGALSPISLSTQSRWIHGMAGRGRCALQASTAIPEP